MVQFYQSVPGRYGPAGTIPGTEATINFTIYTCAFPTFICCEQGLFNPSERPWGWNMFPTELLSEQTLLVTRSYSHEPNSRLQ